MFNKNTKHCSWLFLIKIYLNNLFYTFTNSLVNEVYCYYLYFI